jgi:hypothetical protein
MRRASVLVCLLFVGVTPPAQQSAIPPAERVSDGVQLYRLDHPSLLSPAGPVAVQGVRPRKAGDAILVVPRGAAKVGGG